MKKTSSMAVRLLAALLALALTGLIAAAGVSAALSRLLTDTAWHTALARDEALVAEELERAQAAVRAEAEARHFDPETVLPLVTADSLRRYSGDVVRWWQGFLTTNGQLLAPAWNAEGLAERLAADPVLAASVPADSLHRTIEKQVLPGVSAAVGGAVLPLRTELLSFSFGKVRGRVDLPKLISALPWLPRLLAAAAVLCAALLLLLLARSLPQARQWIAGAVAAGGLLLFGSCLLVHLFDLPGHLAAVSPMLSHQAAVTLTALGTRVGLAAAALTVCGGLLLHFPRDLRQQAGEAAS